MPAGASWNKTFVGKAVFHKMFEHFGLGHLDSRRSLPPLAKHLWNRIDPNVYNTIMEWWSVFGISPPLGSGGLFGSLLNMPLATRWILAIGVDLTLVLCRALSESDVDYIGKAQVLEAAQTYTCENVVHQRIQELVPLSTGVVRGFQ